MLVSGLAGEVVVSAGDSLGDRMKANYEAPARHLLTRRTPVIIRIDGRAFHTYTRGMNRPFDAFLMSSMHEAATHVAADAQGCKLAYVQSDEVSLLLTDDDSLKTQAWFGYVQSKMETIAASLMTAKFNDLMLARGPLGRLATFDARAFNIPEPEIANYFLWRAKDWERNSVSMYCGAHFSHKEMHGKGRAAQHEMLHSIGKNWATNLSHVERNGMFMIARKGGGFDWRADIAPTYRNMASLVSATLHEWRAVEGE